MVTTSLNPRTPEEYLALERHADRRSEYIDGQIVTVPEATRPHNLIVAALVSQLERHLLNGPCEVYTSTQCLKVSASGDYLYPDVVVSCDPWFEDSIDDNLLTPALIIEVLSDSTEQQDRGKKFALYRRIESLREYVLVSQKRALVEQYVRQGDSWRFTAMENIEASLNLASIGMEIPLRRLYQKALTPARRV